MVKGHKGLMFLVFLFLGILINLQFRSILENPSSDVSAREIAMELEAEKAKGRQLMEELSMIEAEYDRLLKNMGDRQNNSRIRELIMQRDFEYFRAGLTDVSGDGVSITMQDAQEPGEMDISEYIIHDSDINAILNELKINGAEAISINGERILGISKLVCAGPTIFLNESRYPPPYVIKAIGDPDILYDAIEKLPGVAIMRIYGIRIEVRKEYDMIIEKYRRYQSIDQLLSGLEVVSR
jgi:uncharacterized protein YlxW (UPF0749 family)